MFFTTCPIQIQWEKQLENNISDFQTIKKLTIVE